MRAWQVGRLGEPREALDLVELPVPEPADGEVLVRVRAAALGFPDYLLAKGEYHDKPELPFVPGGEAAGTVEAVGPGVTAVAAGDRVIAAPGPTVAGRLAEYVTVPADLALALPDGMPWPEAAALFVAYHTAWIGLDRRGRLRPGETLLVHGASGGVGSAAVQLGKALGAQVIAVAGGRQKTAFCAAAGADEVIDHTTEDFVSRVREITAGRGADVILDPVGGEVFAGSTRCIAVEGRLLVAGFVAGIPAVRANHALLRNYSVVGFRTRPFRDDPDYRRTVHDTLIGFWRSGRIRPPVTCVPFGDVPSAVERIGARAITGRLVVTTNS